jgi:hypothetical protein
MLMRNKMNDLKQAYEEDTSTLMEFREPSEGITEKTEDGLLYMLANGTRKLLVPQGKQRQVLGLPLASRTS